MSGWRVRGNDNKWDLIGKRSPQDPQLFYPVQDEGITIRKNDILAARCTMVSSIISHYAVCYKVCKVTAVRCYYSGEAKKLRLAFLAGNSKVVGE